MTMTQIEKSQQVHPNLRVQGSLTRANTSDLCRRRDLHQIQMLPISKRRFVRFVPRCINLAAGDPNQSKRRLIWRNDNNRTACLVPGFERSNTKDESRLRSWLQDNKLSAVHFTRYDSIDMYRNILIEK